MQSSPSIQKIALLAPFEGRYRDIGYNALYAVRLAMADNKEEAVHLLAVDDGGSTTSSISRIRALNLDPDVEVILALGPSASHPDLQNANEKPMVVIGFWGHIKIDEDVLFASNSELSQEITHNEPITDLPEDEPVVGSNLLMLTQLTDIYDDVSDISIVSSGTLPDDEFYQRYIASDLYVPEPNLLATLTYDITSMVISALHSNSSLDEMTYSGINGDINFVNGYWQEAPIHRYQYQNGALVQVD